MKVFYAVDHRSHWPAREFYRGRLVACYENPKRIDAIEAALHGEGLSFQCPPATHDPGLTIATVHDAKYLQFLATIHDRWCRHYIDAGEALDPARTEIIPHTFPTRNLQPELPASIHGEVGFYAMDTASPITSGTWRATLSATKAATAAVAAVLQDDCSSAFALGRPPGHHACRDSYGGYCFLSHAAIAAQYWLQHLPAESRIAILDVDFHHGNGTQQIFYERSDVLFASLHADPSAAYPYFLGRTDETGAGEGEGFNANFPLPLGTRWPAYLAQLENALQRISDFGADGLVISFGGDTHETDPISGFRLTTKDFREMGRRITNLRLPTVTIMEGGYDLQSIGPAVTNFLLQ